MSTTEGRAIIMLVDDDAAIRHFARRVLAEYGYEVIEAGDGAEALEAATARDGPIDLLLTDLIMPKINGLVLAERLSQQRSQMGVLYISGYVEATILSTKHPDRTVLQKPFTADGLINAVRSTLASKKEKGL